MRIAIDIPRPIAEFLTHSFTLEELRPPDPIAAGFDWALDSQSLQPFAAGLIQTSGTGTAFAAGCHGMATMPAPTAGPGGDMSQTGAVL